MAMPPTPAEPTPEELATVVAWLMESQGDEDEQVEACAYLDKHLPDPAWSDIVYWPSRHAETRAMGIDESTRPGLSSEQVVEIALRYRPIAL